MHLRSLVLLLLLRAAWPPADDDMASAARHSRGADSEQKAKAAFVFESLERENWHFIPKDRNGLPPEGNIAPPNAIMAYALLNLD